MSHPEATNNSIPTSSALPGVRRTETSLSDSALYHILSPAAQSSIGQRRLWNRSSGHEQDLEMGIITEPGDNPGVDENEDDVIEISSANGIPDPMSNTTDANVTPFDLSRLVAYLALNAANRADNDSVQIPAADSTPQLDDMDSDDAIAAVIDHIDESSYPAALEDLENSFPGLGSLNPPGTLIGMQSMKALGMVLHTYEISKRNVGHLSTWENYYYMRYLAKLFYSDTYRPKPKEFLRHLHHFLVFLKSSRELKTPQEFLNFLKEVGGNPEVTVELTWVFLQLSLLLFNIEPQDLSMPFTQYISSVFPPSKRRREKFTIKLDDIIDVGLKVEPTPLLGKHLTIENRTVRIFCPSGPDLEPLCRYKNSRFALELGISTLGREVFSSLFVLYEHSAELTKLALDLHVRPESKDSPFEWFLSAHETGEPKVLAGRLDALEDLIAREGAWWRSLLRDIRKRSRERPFEFWASIFAAILFITVIIQTVTSVISCFYTVRQYQVALATLPTH